jgi:histidinol-phosphate aminotransferase
MVKPSSFVQSLEPYRITPQDVWSEGAPQDLLKLDWNEAPHDFDLYRQELRRIADERGMVAWYPDYLALQLTDALSRFLGIDGNLVLTFPGSDVGLETLCRAYLEPGDVVVALCPTYENFFVYALQTGARLEKLELQRPFEISEEAIARRIAEAGPAKAAYLASPNNPCGYLIPATVVESIATRFPETMIIVDEAYIEFADAPSCAPLVERLPNVVVARTFSKGFGMAGLRLGYLCAALDVVNTVNKIRNGKNISMLSQRLGLHALKNFERIRQWINEVKASRRAFGTWCDAQGLKHYPSHGNFVLFEVRRPNELCSALKSDGIYVRNRHSMLPGCVRATMGSRAQVDRLTTAIGRFQEFL